MKILTLLIMLALSFPMGVHAQRDFEIGEDNTYVDEYIPAGTTIMAEVVEDGEHGQVSTIFGNGAQGQGTMSMDAPRYIDKDSKGNVWFIDGSQRTAKLRKTDGEKNYTVVDLVNNKVTRRDGYFAASGLVVINDTVYVSNTKTVYKLVDENRITELDKGISSYMRQNKLEYVYRMEEYDGDLYLLLRSKNGLYTLVSYDLETKDIEEKLSSFFAAGLANFYVDDQGILIASYHGEIWYHNFFPRRTTKVIETNEGQIQDVWADENDEVWFVLWKDKTEFYVLKYLHEPGQYNSIFDMTEIVAGGYEGYQDGIADEVQMSYPVDFVWDGTGMLFGDMGNNTIRKLWLDVKPYNVK